MNSSLLNSIRYAISQGIPVLMAFGVYYSFESTGPTGIIPMPNPSNGYENPNDPVDPFMGGHEVAIVGYDDTTQQLEVANSWGTEWGNDGFFYMPYAYVTNTQLAYDFCVIMKQF